MPNVILRPVSANDHAAWLPLWQAYLRFYQTELADEVSAVTWQRILDSQEPTHSALAWIDGKAVGMVNWIYHRTNWSIANACYLQDLYVDAARPGRWPATDRTGQRQCQSGRLLQGALADT